MSENENKETPNSGEAGGNSEPASESKPRRPRSRKGGSKRDGAKAQAGNGGNGGNGGGGRKRGDGGGRRRRRGGRGRGRSQQHDAPDAAVALESLPSETKTGLVEVMNEGYGFMRFAENYYLPDENDVYVNANLIRKYSLRSGSMVEGEVVAPQRRGQKPSLVKINSINEKPPEEHANETPFKNLVPCDPNERYLLENYDDPNISMRVVDLLAPIGKGQRALIVAPPRTGKTIILQQMANAISQNYPDVRIIVLLIDERPEEVTDFKRNTTAEVIASCLDEGTANHVKVTELVLEKVKRQVEAGHDVVVLLDSITRLGRAYNNETKHSGRILSGGVDAKTLAKPKAFFGAARNIEDGGSLTIIATALIDTGSRMDQVIFEEFKGTGNMELVLSRQLANNRIFPAIDIPSSGTRKEEKLLHPDELQKVNVLRRVLNQLNPNEAMRLLIDKMEKSASNAEFLAKFDISDD